ncbi:MAG: hypothetical protein AAB665_02050 [Patescibacteria group bacterium]
MAKVDLYEIVRRFERHFTEALEEAVEKAAPDAEFDREALFRNFRDRVERHFGRSTEVPDEFVEVADKK